MLLSIHEWSGVLLVRMPIDILLRSKSNEKSSFIFLTFAKLDVVIISSTPKSFSLPFFWVSTPEQTWDCSLVSVSIWKFAIMVNLSDKFPFSFSFETSTFNSCSKLRLFRVSQTRLTCCNWFCSLISSNSCSIFRFFWVSTPEQTWDCSLESVSIW